jgi:hypothetical protein
VIEMAKTKKEKKPEYPDTRRSNGLFAGFPSKRANASEPERTPNLAILATDRPALFRPAHGLIGQAGVDLRRYSRLSTTCFIPGVSTGFSTDRT